MDGMNNQPQEGNVNSDILFSKTIKAGKRVYYIDVKCDSRGEYYLSMTESKRVKNPNDAQRMLFEKHKLFLYREDMEYFQRAFDEAVAYINNVYSEQHKDASGYLECEATASTNSLDDTELKINIDF